MKKLSVGLQVSHDGKGFHYLYLGAHGVIDADGNITVSGPKNSPVKIEFTLLAGEGVESVRFLPRPHKSIRVGPPGSRCPPSPTAVDPEFYDEQHGKSDNVDTIKDKKTPTGDGRYPYALHFEADLANGDVVQDFSDPMFINN